MGLIIICLLFFGVLLILLIGIQIIAALPAFLIIFGVVSLICWISKKISSITSKHKHSDTIDVDDVVESEYGNHEEK